jgi:hypothetical protein
VIDANKIFEFSAGEKEQNRIKEIAAPPISVPCVFQIFLSTAV